MATIDIENTPQFCFQCEQTAHGEACTVSGVCGKNPEVSALQDNLIYGLQALAVIANKAVNAGKEIPHDINEFHAMAVFSTLTNVNFQPKDFVEMIHKTMEMTKKVYHIAGVDPKDASLPEVCKWNPTGKSQAELVKEAEHYRINKRFAVLGKDRVCLQELIVYGIKGVAAYLYHAMEFGAKNYEVSKFIYKAFAFIHEDKDPSVDNLLKYCLDTGASNYLAMETLDHANTSHYGHPVPTTIPWVKTGKVSPVPGKCVLISGHDLLALENLLKEIEKKGVDVYVYTHGEMLPANGYPELKKHKHLAGHYGTAWQNQRKEFENFPGPILMTTNCYVPAPDSYVHRVFSLEPVGGLDVNRIGINDYTKVIETALSMPGFEKGEVPDKLTVGFARNTVIGAAGTVLGAVEKKELRRIVLIGGCDGYEKERNYYTELAEQLPSDTLILTLACGKYKINGREYGTLGSTGLPRLLDMGQCNDTYSAIAVAVALAGALKCDVNSLPLSLVLSWFEQKAVAVLLTLLHLGIKDIYVGPRIPAFFTPTILGVLVDKFHLHVVGNVQEDIKAIMH